MANPGYLRSTDGNDADNGSTWALANATLAGAFTDAAAGDRIWVSGSHAETQASSMTLTAPGTAASPNEILCVNDAAEPPTSLATTATIGTTLGSAIAFAGFAYVEGIAFEAGVGSGNAASLNFQSNLPWWWRMKNCTLRLGSTNTANRINVGNNNTGTDDGMLELIDCTLRFGATAQGIVVKAPFVWRGGSISGSGSAPTTLFLAPGAGNAAQYCIVENVDLSNVGTNLVQANSGSPSHYRFVNCKLPAGVNVVSGSNNGQGGVVVTLVNCDSGDTNYRYFRETYSGDEYHESTIVRSGGASDGTNSFARKIVTTANAKFICPYESESMLAWCDSLTSTTITVEVITDNVTLTDGEAWIEVSYQGTSGFPVGTTVSDAKSSIIATSADQTTSSVTWTTTGLTTPVKQKLAVTFTPAEKGWAIVRVMLAKASTTMYYCPKPDKT